MKPKLNLRTTLLFLLCMFAVVLTSAGQAPTPKTGYAQVNGLKMYYEVYGTGQPIVLIHGAFNTISTCFGALIPELSKTRQVIAVELQGHGHTADIARPFSFESMADDVSGLLDQLKISNADVFGYSLGGGVALQLAIRHQLQVKKLIIASAVYKSDGWSAETRSILPILTPEMFEGTPIKTDYVKVAPDPKNWANFVNKMKTFVTTPYDFTENKIKAIKSPTLIIVGDGDGVLPEHAVDMFRMRNGKYMVDFGPLPATQLAMFPGTSHISVMMHTDWMMALMKPFLEANFQESHH